MQSQANRTVFLILVISAVFGCGPALAARAKQTGPVISSVKDTVLVRVPESEWYPCNSGTRVKPNMSIKTGGRGRAAVSIGEGNSMVLLPGTELFIKSSLDKKAEGDQPHIVLYSGTLVIKRDDGDGFDLAVSAPNADAVMGKGVFTFTTEPEKHSTFGVVDGRGCVFAKSKKACAGEDQQISVRKNSLPGNAAPADGETLALWKAEGLTREKGSGGGALFLSIQQPQDGSFATKNPVVFAGRTTPGASVTVKGDKADVKDNGEFSAKVKLYEGENKITVEAKIDDKKKSVTVKVLLDTSPPLLTISQPTNHFDPSMYGNCRGRKCYIQVFGITEPGVTLRINRVDVSRYIEDDGSFFINDFPVDTDETTLIFEAEDEFRQRSRQVLTVAQAADMDGDGTPDTQDSCPADPMCR